MLYIWWGRSVVFVCFKLEFQSDQAMSKEVNPQIFGICVRKTHCQCYMYSVSYMHCIIWYVPRRRVQNQLTRHHSHTHIHASHTLSAVQTGFQWRRRPSGIWWCSKKRLRKQCRTIRSSVGLWSEIDTTTTTTHLCK